MQRYPPPGPNQQPGFPRVSMEDLEALRESSESNPIASHMLDALDAAMGRAFEWREKLRKALVRCELPTRHSPNPANALPFFRPPRLPPTHLALHVPPRGLVGGEQGRVSASHNLLPSWCGRIPPVSGVGCDTSGSRGPPVRGDAQGSHTQAQAASLLAGGGRVRATPRAGLTWCLSVCHHPSVHLPHMDNPAATRFLATLRCVDSPPGERAG